MSSHVLNFILDDTIIALCHKKLDSPRSERQCLCLGTTKSVRTYVRHGQDVSSILQFLASESMYRGAFSGTIIVHGESTFQFPCG